MAVTLRGILCLILLLRMLGGIFLTRSEAMVKNCEKKSSKRVKLPLQSSCLWYLYDICLFIFISVLLYLLFLPLCSLPIQQKGVGTAPSPSPGCRGLVESDVWVELNHVTTNRKLQICFSNELRRSASWKL